jgi:hypothetical protein
MKIVVIQSEDYKIDQWRTACEKSNIELLSSGRSVIYDPFYIISLLSRHKRPNAYVFRYLNDYPNLARTLTRLVSEILTVSLCFIFKINIGWLCHNVDRETVCHYPSIMNIRRKTLCKISKSIFVTDPTLIPIANKILTVPYKKLSFITFGPTISSPSLVNSYSRKQMATLTKRPNIPKHTLIGGSFAYWTEKRLAEIEFIRDMSRHKSSPSLYFIIGGQQVEVLMKKHPELYSDLLESGFVHFVPGFATLEDLIKFFSIDFIVKNYSDYSIPLGLYHALTCNLPIVSQQGTYIGDMIEHYNIGVTIPKNMVDLEHVTIKIKNLSKKNLSNFLLDHNWETATIAFNRLF